MNGFAARARRARAETYEGRQVRSIGVRGADQVLRPPEDRLPYLRHDRAAELRLEPGSLTTRDSEIADFAEARDAELQLNATGCAVVPGFVDCHTHLPFVGWRAGEYALKIAGVPYAEIVKEGGGISASSEAFAPAADWQVLRQARALADEMLQAGTTTLECKSGYGLSIPAELRALRLARRLDELIAPQTVRTALLAHAVPPGRSATEWMDEVRAAAAGVVRDGAASALDIYVETVAFSNDDLATMAALARDNGVALRCHVEQFSTQRSVPVAVEHGARSVDHLACLHPDDVAMLASSECAAVLRG